MVRETRTRAPGTLRRVRECANGHRFGSVEQLDAPARLRQWRDKQMVQRVLAGQTMTEVAREFGLAAPSDLNRLMHRLYPGQDWRSAGQLRKWAKRRGHATSQRSAAPTVAQALGPASEPAAAGAEHGGRVAPVQAGD